MGTFQANVKCIQCLKLAPDCAERSTPAGCPASQTSRPGFVLVSTRRKVLNISGILVNFASKAPAPLIESSRKLQTSNKLPGWLHSGKAHTREIEIGAGEREKEETRKRRRKSGEERK